ncbi:MAG: hypothetical protein LIO92_12555 [Clostridiales bacterium]|nr:hypothetical protein [Clostridiales bacterium]
MKNPAYTTPDTKELQSESAHPERSGRFLELESLKIEYENLFDRSNKLDNKVYIAITFCGFLFVFITGLFSGISQLLGPDTLPEMIAVFFYILFCSALMVSYVYVLIYFMRMLQPEHIVRVDPEIIQSEALETVNSDEACRRLICIYRKIINENLDKLHLRCDEFVRGLRYVYLTVVLAFLAYAFQVLLRLIQ